MKILTLNTWQERGEWKERWEVTLEGIRHLAPDIVAFQELFNRSWAQEVQKRTGFSTLLFHDEQCGLVVFTRYPAADWGGVTLSQSPWEDYHRYALWAELEVERQSLFIFNTHFSWMLEDGATRSTQAEEVLNLILEKAPDQESVLMGDLNAPHRSPEIRALIHKGSFHDTFFKCHPKESGFTWDNRNPYVASAEHKLPDRRIDFILTRGSGPLLKNLVSCDRVFTQPNQEGIWASDHYGVWAEFN